MLQLAKFENLYLQTIVARLFFFFGHGKKRLLGYVNPIEGRKGKFKSVLIKRSFEKT